MKINWIIPEATQSGGIIVALQYANKLVERGHDVVCYAPLSGQHYGWKRILFPKEVIKTCLNSYYRGDWFNNKFTFEFPLWINNKSIRDADVTIATSWITSYWVNNLDNTKGKKVYFIQGFETWGDEKTNEIVKSSYNLPFDKRITVSTELHNRLIKECDSDSVVICNGVEEVFTKNLGKKNNNQLVIGFPYRETRGDDIKNCIFAIRVLNKLHDKHPDVKIVTYGFKKPDGWSETIEFLENPTRNELVNFYHNVNIFYVPSIYEGWGLPAMEAMAQSCCVLASNTGVIKEIGIDNKNCIIINNPKDEIEVFNKLERVCNDSILRKEIGDNAKKMVADMTQADSQKMFEETLKDTIEGY